MESNKETERAMRIAVYVYLIVAAAASAAGQVLDKSRHCPAATLPDDALLIVCRHERGMAPLIQPRLYFNAGIDGRGEFETDAPGGLAIRKVALTEAELSLMKGTLELPETLSIADEYGSGRMFTDSSVETRMILRVGSGTKTVVLRNFMPDDYDAASRFPAPLVLLMRTIESSRNRALGVVRNLPHLSFDTMINYPDYTNRREIVIYADYEHRVTTTAGGTIASERERLTDHAGNSQAEVDMKYEGTPAQVAAMKNILARTKEHRFGGRGRILVRGRYEETVEPATRERIRTFFAYEVKGVDPIDLPFVGEIKLGWNYVDTIRRSNIDEDLKLSSPLRLPIHNAGTIEWMNVNQFPQVKKPGMRSILFRANSQTRHQVEKYSWRNTFHLTILEAR